jgi:predicted PurR-regulated permease PerM
MPLTTSQQRALTWLALAAAAAALLRVLGSTLAPVALALALAYLLWPLVRLLERRRLPRPLAAAATVLAAMAAAAVLVLLLVPIVTTLLPMLHAQWPSMLDKFERVVAPRLSGWGVPLDVATIRERLLSGGNVEEWGGKLLASARIGGSWLVTIAGFAVLVPVLAFYLLLDAERASAGAWSLVPLKARPPLAAFLGECDATLRQYLRGQLSVMAAMALFYPIALTVAGLKLAWPIGVFTGMAAFIPYLGYGTGLVLALMTAAIQFGDWQGPLGVAAAYALGQVLESFVLTPRLVGERIGLAPLAVILSLMAFGEVFGFVGLLVALPASAVGIVALRHALAAYRASGFYRA